MMTRMLEFQIALKLFTKRILFSSSNRIAKVIKKTNMKEVGKVINKIRNYFKIKITEDSIEQKQFVNGSIWKIEKVALRKAKDNIKDFIIIAIFIL